MPRITANISSDAKLQRAKIAAVKAKKSLRNWAGQVIEAQLDKSVKSRKVK